MPGRGCMGPNKHPFSQWVGSGVFSGGLPASHFSVVAAGRGHFSVIAHRILTEIGIDRLHWPPNGPIENLRGGGDRNLGSLAWRYLHSTSNASVAFAWNISFISAANALR